VFEVAPHAVPSIGVLHPKKCVVALMHGETIRNLFVAFEALERRRAGSELVAGVALCRTVEGFVSFGEGARRNLRAGTGGAEEEST